MRPGLPVRPPPPQFQSQPKQPQGKIIMDAQGRLTDEHGNVILVQRHHELKINEKSVKDMRTKDLERLMKFGKSTQNATN